ncbi:MAG: lytic murein transglycosylase [Solirubrobacteraceae bacterium]|nr:lytic murein transglycosylase [Solirubrobacteraceae bacterium]
MRQRGRAAAVSAAATAALAALAAGASAQEPGQAAQPAAPSTTTTTPGSTTPAPAPPASDPTDLGSFDVQVGAKPDSGRTSKPTAGDRRRRGARRFLSEERAARGRDEKLAARDVAGAPFAGLPAPGAGSDMLAPPAAGVPNMLLEDFRIPPFLLPIYQAAGIEYGIRWEVLAAINEIETDYGRNLNVSSAGALGWMQFMPATWETYGTDANEDGRKDPYNPVDAIFAAARYLKAAGAGEDLRAAIWAYNHADWYVDDVLRRAQRLSTLPAELVGALTGLTTGRFPVLGAASYAGGYDRKARRGDGAGASVAVGGKAGRTSATIHAREGAPVIAVQDARVVAIGATKRLGRFVRIRDAYGNTYTYAGLGAVASHHVVPRVSEKARDASAAVAHAEDPAPTTAASAGTQRSSRRHKRQRGHGRSAGAPAAGPAQVKERLFANPSRPRALRAGGQRQLAPQPAHEEAPRVLASGELGRYLAPPYTLRRGQVALLPLRKGSQVIAGTILGHVGAATSGRRANVRFGIRPAGSGAPRIDPTPILDGWRLLETTDVYGAASPLLSGRQAATIGQILLMSKEALERRVLADPDVDIYRCGRDDIRSGVIDRRVLALLEYLATSGLKPTVTSLRCGHGYYTSSGNVSHHTTGTAVDIAAVNGTPILGHQGAGSITDTTVRRILALQGSMKPAQIITLMRYAGTDNTLAMADHDDHIHVGFRPQAGSSTRAGRVLTTALRPGQWNRLMSRLSSIQNPTVPLEPSRYSIKVKVKVKKDRAGR